MTLEKINGNFANDFETWVNDYQPLQIDYSKSIPQSMEKLFA